MTRSITIIINERCPLRCKHCSVGFSETNHGNSHRIDKSDLVRMIEAISRTSYTMALFAGGEPSLDPEHVKLGIDTCKRVGLQSAMATAPVWAATPKSAKFLLSKLSGLDCLILSYDYYHLEFLKFAHYENAIREAAEQKIQIAVHIAYAKESEKLALMESLEPFQSLVTVHSAPTIRLGNAADPGNIAFEYVTLNRLEDLDSLPSQCLLGHGLVDSKFVVHGCCWSCMGEESPFSVSANGPTVDTAIHTMENRPEFAAVHSKGFLGSLTPKGREMLFEKFRGQRFCNECDLCVAAMKKDFSHIWRECSPENLSAAEITPEAQLAVR